MADYDSDILEWSERQASLLRRRAAGELVDEAELDWPHLAEEIEDVGRSELRSCRSLLRQALRHMLKAEAWPDARDAPTWRADAFDFRRQARDAFTPFMRQRIDVGELYGDALASLPETMDGERPLQIRRRIQRCMSCCVMGVNQRRLEVGINDRCVDNGCPL